jgi:hypothetical protein
VTRQIDAPEAGLFAMRLVKNGPLVGAMIFMRLGHLAALVNGQPADVEDVWTSGREITFAEYQRLMANAPADPYQPINHASDAPAF